jgi:hypothetical protein
VSRIAAFFAVAVIAIAIYLDSVKDPCAKITYDWPLIGAYTALFLSIAWLDHLRGFTILAVLTAAFGIATAVFDTVENLRAKNCVIEISAGKWFCFFIAVILAALLFAATSHWLARVSGGLLILAGAFGVVASFFIATNLPLVKQAAIASMAAFIPAIVILVWKPQLFR